jgi:hypothetical protein
MRTFFIGLACVALIGTTSCSSGGAGSVTAPSSAVSTPVVVGTQPTEAPCKDCTFTAVPQGLQLRLTWAGFFKGNNATCEITTVPVSGPYTLTTCDEGTRLVDYPIVPTTYTLTVNKNQGNDPPQIATVPFHPPVGIFAGPTTAAAGHHGWLTVEFGAMNGDVHNVTATWRSDVANDDDPGIVYEGTAAGVDASMSVNAVSSTRCNGTAGPQATFSGSFVIVDSMHITGGYDGSACHPSAGTFALTRQ